MKIIALPAFKRTQNPYQALLYKGMLHDKAVSVDEFSAKKILLKKYDIVHLHWPESNKLRKDIVTAILYIIVLNLILKIAKLKGAKIMWTVHDIQPHHIKFPRLNKLHFNLFTLLVNSVIAMNNYTIKNIIHYYPNLKNKPFAIIPHGHYKDSYENKISFEDARKKLNLDVTDQVFLILGQIKPYKNLENVISIFKKINNKSYKLIIAGEVLSEYENYKQIIIQNIADDTRIIFYPRFIEYQELQMFFNAADAVILPYTMLLNSGVLILALTFNKPVAVPYFESLAETKEAFNDWILFYEKLNEYTFEEILKIAYANRNKTVDMSSLEWIKIGKQTIQFFDEQIKR